MMFSPAAFALYFFFTLLRFFDTLFDAPFYIFYASFF